MWLLIFYLHGEPMLQETFKTRTECAVSFITYMGQLTLAHAPEWTMSICQRRRR